MRRVNVDRMRKVNLAALYENFPRRWVTGLPAVEPWDAVLSPSNIFTLPDEDVTFERRPKRTSRYVMRPAEDR